MKQVLLHYYGAQVGHALVDDLIDLSPAIIWRAEIPMSMRRRGYRPDVMLGLLREDPISLARCHPIYTLNSTFQFDIKLAKLVMRPQLIIKLNQLIELPRSAPRREALAYEIVHALRQVNRIIYINDNKTDCRGENLREVEVDLPDPDHSELFHMD